MPRGSTAPPAATTLAHSRTRQPNDLEDPRAVTHDGDMTDPTDLSTRAAALSARLGVSRTAAEVTLDAHVIDLHIDTLIPPNRTLKALRG